MNNKDMNNHCEHTHKDAPYGDICEDCLNEETRIRVSISFSYPNIIK